VRRWALSFFLTTGIKEGIRSEAGGKNPSASVIAKTWMADICGGSTKRGIYCTEKLLRRQFLGKEEMETMD